MGLWRAEVEGNGGAVDHRMLWWAWGHSLWPDRGAVAYVQMLMQTMERGRECAGPEGVGGAVLGKRLGRGLGCG